MPLQNKSNTITDVQPLSQFIEKCNPQQTQQVNDAILRFKEIKACSKEQATAGLAYRFRIALSAWAIGKVSIDEVITQFHAAKL